MMKVTLNHDEILDACRSLIEANCNNGFDVKKKHIVLEIEDIDEEMENFHLSAWVEIDF